MTPIAEASAPVRKSITVNAKPERAFRVSTEGIYTWWPRSHHIGKSPMQQAIIEGRAAAAVTAARSMEPIAIGAPCWYGIHRNALSWHGRSRRPGATSPTPPVRARSRCASRRWARARRASTWNTAIWSATAQASMPCGPRSIRPAAGVCSSNGTALRRKRPNEVRHALPHLRVYVPASISPQEPAVFSGVTAACIGGAALLASRASSQAYAL